MKKNSSKLKYLGSTVLLTFNLFNSQLAMSAEAKDVNHFVPEGKIFKEKKNEFKFKTSAGTIVKIEAGSDASLKEASGDAAIRGDVFVPGMDLLSLKDVTEALAKLGKVPAGEWKLEKSFLGGWIYEFEGKEKNKEMEYEVDAKTGQLLKVEEED